MHQSLLSVRACDSTRTTGGSFLPDGYTIVYLLDQLGTDFLESTLPPARKEVSDERERQAGILALGLHGARPGSESQESRKRMAIAPDFETERKPLNG